MDIRESMEKKRKDVEKAIEDFLELQRPQCPGDPHSMAVFDALKEFTLRGGKRVRAILVVQGYMAVGGKDIRKALHASVALELIQSMLLIHDDIIDRSPERRGGPSLHRVFENMHVNNGYRGSPERFGINMAIIAGDLAESLGEKALLTSGFEDRKVQRALLRQADMIRDTGFGQVLDIHSEALPQWSEEMVLNVQTLKTARYTLEGPLQIGACLHGADEEQMKVLSDFATPVGISFQLIDDILGFYGDPRRGGKEDLADIAEGKRTMLITRALDTVDHDHRRIIEDALGDPDLSVEEAERVRSVIRKSGSEKYSREMASRLNHQGIEVLQGSSLDPAVKCFLTDLSDYLLKRA